MNFAYNLISLLDASNFLYVDMDVDYTNVYRCKHSSNCTLNSYIFIICYTLIFTNSYGGKSLGNKHWKFYSWFCHLWLLTKHRTSLGIHSIQNLMLRSLSLLKSIHSKCLWISLVFTFDLKHSKHMCKIIFSWFPTHIT